MAGLLFILSFLFRIDIPQNSRITDIPLAVLDGQRRRWRFTSHVLFLL
jgi:hypothetical protein